MPMLNYGLLLLSYRPNQLSAILSQVGSYLKVINSKISRTLYISLESNQRFTSVNFEPDHLAIGELNKVIPRIYVEAHKHVPLLDVRVLHQKYYHQSNINATLSGNSQFVRRKLRYLPEVVFTTGNLTNDTVTKCLEQYSDKSLPIVQLDQPVSDPSIQLESAESGSKTEQQTIDRVYERVCLGGTFDNIHNGHKIFLSTALLKCTESVTIGVTDQNMVSHKTLCELIDSPENRISELSSLLQDIDPYLEYKITPISDPYGPAIVDESLQAIIVSEETVRGGQKINEIRASKNMSPLEIVTIPLLDDEHKQSDAEENKVSSSSLRFRKLGTLLREPQPRPNLAPMPYIIGLTGMVASGKSSISEMLRKLGAGVINVDLLAHQTYRSSTMPAFKEIVANFGEDILDSSNNIDRSKLGKIVFNDEKKLALLNQIIWPKVEQLMLAEIKQLKDKYKVIVLEIALLIEANWVDKVHQVWLTILHENEVIRRLQVRNRLSPEDALKRVRAMEASHEKVEHANVVFCTQWSESVTWEQVQRAWAMINQKYVTQ